MKVVYLLLISLFLISTVKAQEEEPVRGAGVFDSGDEFYDSAPDSGEKGKIWLEKARKKISNKKRKQEKDFFETKNIENNLIDGTQKSMTLINMLLTYGPPAGWFVLSSIELYKAWQCYLKRKKSKHWALYSGLHLGVAGAFVAFGSYWIMKRLGGKAYKRSGYVWSS